ncbi:Putative DNA glycosylase At3g47830 [Coccomyxa sp. Obi]|nr:Putative DNA glycosylase At3g47830 [Coccomyxa sp. Obi]
MRRRTSEEPKIKLEHDVEPKVKTEFDVEPKVEVKGVSITPESPFPGHMRPTPEECRAARDALAALHGEPGRHKLAELEEKTAAADSLHTHSQQTVLDSLVRTILSQNTTDATSHRAFASLKAAFPGEKGWAEVLRAPSGKVEESIRMGGLAEIKTERIKAILATLLEERGKICMEYLREMSDDAIKAELSRFKGVGKKTVACVLMFCLAREEFPVDTHVWRISKSLGWVPAKATRDTTYEHLNVRVPPDVRYDLHVLMVEHGKRCPRCASNGKPRKESHGDCPLVNLKELAARLKPQDV